MWGFVAATGAIFVSLIVVAMSGVVMPRLAIDQHEAPVDVAASTLNRAPRPVR